MDSQVEELMSVAEVRGWVEFCGWCDLVMTPITWWLSRGGVRVGC